MTALGPRIRVTGMLLGVAFAASGCVEDSFRIQAAVKLEQAVCRCQSYACATALMKDLDQDLTVLPDETRTAILEAEARMNACVGSLKEKSTAAQLESDSPR